MFPLCVIFVFAYQNYKVFPEISYINVNNNDIVLVQYKRDTIAVTTGNINVMDLKVPIKIDNVFQGYLGDSTMNLGDRCIIRLISHGKKLEAQVCFLEKSNIKPNLEVFNDKWYLIILLKKLQH